MEYEYRITRDVRVSRVLAASEYDDFWGAMEEAVMADGGTAKLERRSVGATEWTVYAEMES